MKNNSVANRILALKAEKQVYIIAHYYQRDEVQDVADFVGDSYAMAVAAKSASEPYILVAGVDFMAESAAILCPDKTVISPEPAATCPMANGITVDDILAYREKHPDVLVISYVNTPADVKAVSDICVTSSNAQKIVGRLDRNQRILFVPDQNLGLNISRRIGREMEYFPGSCPIHAAVTVDAVLAIQAAHPGVKTLVHPECSPEVAALADYAGSTGGILDYVKNSSDTEFIIGTEQGIFHAIEQARPGVKLYLAAEELICPNMKSITAEKVLFSLQTLETKITVPGHIADQARLALEKMIAWAS